MSEYKERYLPFMEYMAKRGYVCVIHDHRGHGKSVRAMDDLGYMYGGGADAILKDIEVVNREMHQQLPDLPLILFGHSMGSLAVRAFARDHDDCIRGGTGPCGEHCFRPDSQKPCDRGLVLWRKCNAFS